MVSEWSSQRVLIAAGAAEPYRAAELACYLREAGAEVSALALPELIALAGTPRSLSRYVAAGGISHVAIVGLETTAVAPELAAELELVSAGGASIVVCERLGPGAVRFRVRAGADRLPGLCVCDAPDVDLPRYPFVDVVLSAMRAARGRDHGDLRGCRIIVTAGGTQEPIDPVRFIGNHSSGKMGFALAATACGRGAEVSLVSSIAPTAPLVGVTRFRATSVAEMRERVLELARRSDALIMAAALSDFRCESPQSQKIKKKQAEGLTLRLAVNPNFIVELPASLFKVGFAAETERVAEHASRKRVQRGFDVICANDVSRSDIGFGSEHNEVTVFDADGIRTKLPRAPKHVIAHGILDSVLKDLQRSATARSSDDDSPQT